jgi:hypothetical protein
MAQFPHELHFRCFTLPPSPLLDMPRADELYHARRALSMTTEVPVALGSVAVTIAGEENAGVTAATAHSRSRDHPSRSMAAVNCTLTSVMHLGGMRGSR